jgi:hypothetical protein
MQGATAGETIELEGEGEYMGTLCIYCSLLCQSKTAFKNSLLINKIKSFYFQDSGPPAEMREDPSLEVRTWLQLPWFKS